MVLLIMIEYLDKKLEHSYRVRAKPVLHSLQNLGELELNGCLKTE